MALLGCKSKFRIFELGLISVQIEIQNFRAPPNYGANQTFLIFKLGGQALALLPCRSKFASLAYLRCKSKFSSLTLLRCKSNFLIFQLGLIAVQIKIEDFQAWPSCSINRTFKFFSLALFRCKSKFKIFELDLIAVQTDLWNFRAWPYCRAPV